MAISMLKIRRPLGRLIFNMGIAIPGKTVFLIETAPWSFCSFAINVSIYTHMHCLLASFTCASNPDSYNLYGALQLVWYYMSNELFISQEELNLTIELYHFEIYLRSLTYSHKIHTKLASEHGDTKGVFFLNLLEMVSLNKFFSKLT